MTRSAGKESYYVWNGEVRSAGERVAFDPVSDGLLYGLGCFETMALADGRIRFVREHRGRLGRALNGLNLNWNPPWEEFERAIGVLVRKNSCAGGVARVSLHVEGTGISWMVRVFPGGKFSGLEALRVGFSRFPHPGPSPLGAWKQNNYALNLLAYREGLSKGFDEVVLRRDGKLLEGALSTLWVLKGNELLTPPLEEGVLAGVVRGRMLALGRVGEISFREGTVTEKELAAADGVFFSNAAMLLKPVREVENIGFQVLREFCGEVNAALCG